MITREEIIAAYPSIKVGLNDEVVEVSSGADYDNYINVLLETEEAKEKAAIAQAEADLAKAAAMAKLEALGLTVEDLEALGL